MSFQVVKGDTKNNLRFIARFSPLTHHTKSILWCTSHVNKVEMANELIEFPQKSIEMIKSTTTLVQERNKFVLLFDLAAL